MRGLDTNVLLRYLTDDDPAQSPQARALLEKGERQSERFFVSTVALCELVWTLRGAPYRCDRSKIAGVIGALLKTRVFELDHRDLVRRALGAYRKGNGDFPDYLLREHGDRAGCADTVTFDRSLRGEDGFTLI